MADPHLTLRDLRDGPTAVVDLPEIVDPGRFVHRAWLRERGVNLNTVTIGYVDLPEVGIVTESAASTILFGPETVEFFERHPEYLEIVLAHELVHLTQPDLLASDPMFVTASGRPTTMHARDRDEQEAFFWETQQAAKLGLGREDVEAMELRVAFFAYPPVATPTSREMEMTLKELRERGWANLVVLSRRPVRVSGYRRGRPRRC